MPSMQHRVRSFLTTLLLAGCAPPAVAPDVAPAPDAQLDARDDAPRTDGDAAGACVRDPLVTYPPGPYAVADGEVLPDLSFEAGDDARVSLRQFYTPCAPAPGLLMIRV